MSETKRFYFSDQIYIDFDNMTLYVGDGVSEEFTSDQFLVMDKLCDLNRRSERVVSREILAELVHGPNWEGSEMPYQKARDIITDIRKMCHGVLRPYIVTKIGVGYKLARPANATKWGFWGGDTVCTKAHFQTKNFSGIGPMSGSRYVPRPEALGAIADMVYGNKISFISEIGGMGKSELARQFAKDSTFEIVLPLELDREGNGSYEEIVSNSYINVIGLDSKDNISIKKFELLSAARDNTLVVVDNLNKMPDGDNSRTGTSELLERLIHSTGEAHILVTSQLGEELLSEYGPVLKIERYQDQTFGLEILSKYAEKLLHDNQDAREMVELLGNHTMLLALVGKQLVGKNEASLHETLLDLRKGLNEALQIDFVNLKKDHELFTNVTPYDMLKIIFSSVFNWSFSEVDRQVLGAIILTPQLCHRAEIITELVGDLPKSSACNLARKSLHRLQSLNIVQCSGEEIGLHPLMAHLLSDSDFAETGVPIAELDNNFAFHILRNAFVSTSDCFETEGWGDANNKICYSIIEKYRKMDKDWTGHAFVDNAGWLAFWADLTSQEVRVAHLGVLYNLKENWKDVPYAEYSALYNEIKPLFTRNEEYRWTNRYPQHESLEIITTGSLGACLYLYDCITQNTWKLIDCSEQLSEEQRYYCHGKIVHQHGKMTDAEMVGVYNGCCPKELVLPSMVEDVSITEIAERFIALDELEHISKIVLPESVEVIGDGTFRWCDHLDNISIPSSIRQIGHGAFLECPLDSVVLPYGVKLGVILIYAGSEVDFPERLLDQEGAEYGELDDIKFLLCTLRLGIDILAENGILKVVEDFCPRVDGVSVAWTSIQTPFREECKIIIS